MADKDREQFFAVIRLPDNRTIGAEAGDLITLRELIDEAILERHREFPLWDLTRHIDAGRAVPLTPEEQYLFDHKSPAPAEVLETPKAQSGFKTSLRPLLMGLTFLKRFA